MQGTYSIKTILENHIEPQLCRQLLGQIKSPLLQHSYYVTTDDQPSLPYNNQHNNTNPHPKNHCNISPSSRINLHRGKYLSSPIKNPKIPRQTSSYNNLQPKLQLNSIFFDNTQRIINYQRKKIFQNKQRQFRSPINQQQIQKELQIRKSKQVSISIALTRLNQIGEKQLFNFLGFINNFINKMEQLKQFQLFLHLNVKQIYKILAQSSKSTFNYDSDNKYRVLSRLKACNFVQVFDKILKQPNDQKLSNEVQQNMLKIFRILQQAEYLIQQYTNKLNWTNQIQKVFSILSQIHQQNLYYQLQSLLHYLNVWQLDKKIQNLQYIWSSLFKKISQDDFIMSLSKNDLIIRKKINYDQKLKKNGYQRNK